jgi:hypothetical protein
VLIRVLHPHQVYEDQVLPSPSQTKRSSAGETGHHGTPRHCLNIPLHGSRYLPSCRSNPRHDERASPMKVKDTNSGRRRNTRLRRLSSVANEVKDCA